MPVSINVAPHACLCAIILTSSRAMSGLKALISEASRGPLQCRVHNSMHDLRHLHAGF